MRVPDSIRLRLTPYFLVLALPLGFGIWAFGNYAADNARDRADTKLRASLGAVASSYRAEVANAGVRAHTLAGRADVQRAVRERRPRLLRRLARAYHHTAFLSGRRVLAGRLAASAPKRAVALSNGRRVFGSVVVSVPLDEPLLARLEGAAGIGGSERVLALHRRTPSSGDVRVGGRSYRVASLELAAQNPVRLAVVEPREDVATSEDRARRRVLLAGLAILGGVALAAYALAPTLARSRFAQAQRAQAQQVLSHVGDGVFLVDATGTISFWNAGAEALTGIPPAGALRRRPEELFRGWARSVPRAAPADERPVAKTGRYEIDGTEYWLSVSAVASPVGIVYAFRDLTEEYRLEEARGDFVATVSHELRTPLASIHGAATTLRARNDRLRPATRSELLEIVFEQSERLHQLVDQILLANQLSSGSAHVEQRSFDPAAVAGAAVDYVRRHLPTDVEVDLEAPGALPDVVGDPERVRQVLLVLLENASKYSPGGERIHVAVAETEGTIRFSVRDRGRGIPRTEHERIFEKFYRLDAGMRRGVGGSGLGLFVARELVSLMHGRLWVESEPGAGSTFSFELPVAEPASAALRAAGA